MGTLYCRAALLHAAFVIDNNVLITVVLRNLLELEDN